MQKNVQIKYHQFHYYLYNGLKMSPIFDVVLVPPTSIKKTFFDFPNTNICLKICLSPCFCQDNRF